MLTPHQIGRQIVRNANGTTRPEPLPAWTYHEAPGLCITEWPPIEGDPWPRYTITHITSGARVGVHQYPTKALAEAALARAAGLFDWTQADDVLRATLNLRAGIDASFVPRLESALLPVPSAQVAA